MPRRTRRVVLAVWLLAAPAAAQSVERVSMDVAVSVTQSAGENAGSRPDVILDFTATGLIGKGWVAYIRPWFRHAPAAPYDISTEIYQAAVQYSRAGRISTRLDAGYILTPIGIGMMDMRPDTNPVTMTHLSYVVPMPSFDQGAPASLPVASSYPLGAVFTASTLRWDARAGLTASPPNRGYEIGAAGGNPKLRPFAVLGGGISPRAGLRIGAAYGAGQYATASELTDPDGRGRGLRMYAFEGEFSFGYTRLTGELTRSLIDVARGRTSATQWFVQGAHTLTPRLFAGARREAAAAPPSPIFGPKPALRVNEVSLGYRLTNELLVKNAFLTRKTYYAASADRQYTLSLVWARRFR